MVKNFFSTIKNVFRDLDKIALHILKKGLRFCFFICLISIAILFVYLSYNIGPMIFKVGFGLLKVSIIYAIGFIVCAVTMDTIKKQLI